MKYTIDGFNQERAIDFGMNRDHTLILRWFVDFQGTNRMISMLINDKQYFWVDYTAIAEDLPIMRIQKDRVYRLMKDLVQKQILKHSTVKNRQGTFSYYAIGEKYIDLISDPTPSVKIPNPLGKNTEPPTVELPTPYGENTGPNNSSIINSSTKEINKEKIYKKESSKKAKVELDNDNEVDLEKTVIEELKANDLSLADDQLKNLIIWFKQRLIDYRSKKLKNNQRAIAMQINRLKEASLITSIDNILRKTIQGRGDLVYQNIVIESEAPKLIVNSSNKKSPAKFTKEYYEQPWEEPI